MRLGIATSFLLAALTLLAILSAAACGKNSTDEAPTDEAAPKVVLTVSAARAAVAPMREQVVLPGVTAALRTLTLRAPAAGRIVGLALMTGDSVRRGEVIAHIINREEDAAASGVEAAQKIDPAEAASLARSVKRYSGGPGIAVRVPLDALVTQRVVSPGQVVNEFDPLVELVDPSSVYVDAHAPINQIGELKAGMDAAVVSVLKPGVVYPARVWGLSPTFSAGGTTAPVWVQFAGKDRISEIGASVDVRITTKSVPDAIVIPKSALFEDAERRESYVFTVSGDNRARRTVVAVGIRSPAEVQVTRGLKPGDLVITSGGYALSDGLEVRAAAAPAENSAPAAEARPQQP
jgi:pyruvate/2-oxoglutarate dehydrogenase complex dihydrolipoamide acyltransferase (E2) component